MVTRKTPVEIAAMARAGALLAAVHDEVAAVVRPGVSTAALDELAERVIRFSGALPAFKGYRGYPATLNTSVNDQIVHAIPRPDVRLRAGDVLTVDAGVVLDGYYADAARTAIVGGPQAADPRVRRLVEDTEAALWAGIAQLVLGRRVGDVSAAIAAVGDAGGYGVVADHDGHTIAGHGIGRHLHEDPSVPGRGRPGRGLRLKPGLVLAIEPMFTLGTSAWRVLDDGWTVVTADGALAAHWEHTVAVTEDGPLVLTGSGSTGRDLTMSN
jgi:methionyl aminopeptidase